MPVQTMIHNCADAKAFLKRGNLANQDNLGQFIAHLKMCDYCHRKILATLNNNLDQIIRILAALAVQKSRGGCAGEGSELMRDLANSL